MRTLNMDLSFICTDVKENSFSYELFCTWPRDRLEKAAKSNSEMGFLVNREVFLPTAQTYLLFVVLVCCSSAMEAVSVCNFPSVYFLNRNY